MLENIKNSLQELGETLKNFIKINEQTFLDLNQRIQELESNHLTQQLDPKVWKFLTERIDKLENLSDFKKLEACILDGAQTHLSILKCEGKLKELEEWTRKEEDKIYEKLKELETEINTVRALGSRAFHPKKPPPCPACYGWGRVLTEGAKADFDGMLRADLPTGKECNACEGKGIVWG